MAMHQHGFMSRHVSRGDIRCARRPWGHATLGRVADDRLRTTAEAADWLGVTVGTFHRWVRERKIKPTLRLPGGDFRWDLTELRQQLQPAEGESVGDDDTPNRPSVITAVVTSRLGVLIGHRHDGRPPWTFIAGEQEPGETNADTAVREVKEETGLEVTTGRVIGERVHPRTERHMIYIAATPSRPDDLDVIVGDPDELSAVRWASLAEATDLLPGMFEPVLDHLMRELGLGPA